MTTPFNTDLLSVGIVVAASTLLEIIVFIREPGVQPARPIWYLYRGAPEVY